MIATNKETSRAIKHSTAIDVMSQGRRRNMKAGKGSIAQTLTLTAGNNEIIFAMLTTNKARELERLTRTSGRTFRALDDLAHKVLVACIAEFMNTRSFDATIKVSEIPDFLSVKVNIAELAKLMGRSNVKKACDEIVDAANALFEWEIKRGNTAFHVLGGKAITRGGFLRVSFTAEFYALLASNKATLTTYPLELFKLTHEAYSLGYYMNLNVYRSGNYIRKRINGEGKVRHVVKLQVAKLLRFAGYPDYSQTSKKGEVLDDHSTQAKAKRAHNGWRKRVKEPFERDLDKIQEAGLIVDWYYSHSSRNGKENQLTDKEIEAMENGDMSFIDYSNLYVTYSWGPDVDAEAINARIKKASKKKRRKSNG